MSPVSQAENHQQGKKPAQAKVQNLFDLNTKTGRRLHNGKQMSRSGLGSSIQTSTKIRNKNY